MTTYTFGLTLGAMIRGGVKRKIQALCFVRGLGCEIFEDKGLLESTYYFKVSGDATGVLAFKEYIDSLEAKEQAK